MINRVVNKINVSDALLGNLGVDNIAFRLKERPTKMRPVSAADAPAMAIKKLLHNSTVNYLKTNINKYWNDLQDADNQLSTLQNQLFVEKCSYSSFSSEPGRCLIH